MLAGEQAVPRALAGVDARLFEDGRVKQRFLGGFERGGGLGRGRVDAVGGRRQLVGQGGRVQGGGLCLIAESARVRDGGERRGVHRVPCRAWYGAEKKKRARVRAVVAVARARRRPGTRARCAPSPTDRQHVGRAHAGVRIPGQARGGRTEPRNWMTHGQGAAPKAHAFFALPLRASLSPHAPGRRRRPGTPPARQPAGPERPAGGAALWTGGCEEVGVREGAAPRFEK